MSQRRFLQGTEHDSAHVERVPAWQFATAFAMCVFVGILVVGGVTQWLIKGHFDVSRLLGYSGLFAVAASAGATFGRRQRRQRPRRSEQKPPSS